MPKEKTNNINNQKPGPTSDLPINALHSNIELDSVMEDVEQQTKSKETISNKKKNPKKQSRGLSSKSAMLHTYKEDVRSLVKNRKISMVRALALQSDKPMQMDGDELVTISSKKKTPNGSLNTTFMIFASLLMFTLGTTAIVVAYKTHQKQLAHNLSSTSSPLDNSVIFVEYRTKLDVTDLGSREVLIDLADILDGSNTTLGSITQVLLQDNSETLTQLDLINLLKLSLPDQFIRLLGGYNNYMLGIHSADRNTPFIILTTTSYEHAFASMLEWETSIEKELKPFFSLPTNANSSKRTPNNIVIKNLNARVLRDDSGNIRILYSFLDKDTVLITNNINTFTEISRRYKVRKTSGSGK